MNCLSAYGIRCGNGRHSRLLGDILVMALGQNPFSWGEKTLRKGENRTAYLDALRAADGGDLEKLIKFSKS